MYSAGYLSDFNQKFGIIWADFRKVSQVLNLMKIRPVGAELFHVDGETGRT